MTPEVLADVAAQTGQQSQIHHTFMSFAQGNALGGRCDGRRDSSAQGQNRRARSGRRSCARSRKVQGGAPDSFGKHQSAAVKR